jgi:DNA (cytosine-5)-methyltransferase 1
MQNGALYQLPILVQTIKENEFGSEPNNETFFHTPNTMGLDGGSNSRKALKKRLEWPTAMSTEHKANRQTRENHQNGLTQAVLQAETKMLPTPCNRDYKGAVKSGKRVTKSGKTQNYGEQLPNVVGGQLNPTWVEWLMGWPVGWTDLKPLAMDKSLYVQQLHGSYSNE